MAFDANRDIRIEASQAASGTYTLRTRGLADRRRPELEIAGVPEAGLNAAGGVINILAEYAVNKAEITADQSVGNVLTIGEEGRRLLLAVRAVSSEKPKGGLWSKIAGGGKGVLRLVDVDAKVGDSGAPRTALATMLVHRAAVRLAKDDDEGARAELEAALEVFPGEAAAGAAPAIGGADGELNWQNHLAYLDLATLSDRAGEVDDAAAFFGSALGRSEELARREIGTTVEALASLDAAAIEREAKTIVEHNLATIHPGAGPTSAVITLASPVWELADPSSAEAKATRRGTVLRPAALLALYYEGAAAEGLRGSAPALVGRILAASREEPWRAAWIARGARAAWRSEEGPFHETSAAAHPGHVIVSSILADVARCFCAGATEAEIVARYAAPSEGERARSLEALAEKLARLTAWEGEQYASALGD